MLNNKQNVPNPQQKCGDLPKEPYPLISAAVSPEVPRLVGHQLTSEEILLEEELKLNPDANSCLQQQIETALGLIYWEKTI